MAAMALACRAAQASSDSSALRTSAFSCCSSQASAITVHVLPPAQPYRLAFWNLRRPLRAYSGNTRRPAARSSIIRQPDQGTAATGVLALMPPDAMHANIVADVKRF